MWIEALLVIAWNDRDLAITLQNDIKNRNHPVMGGFEGDYYKPNRL